MKAKLAAAPDERSLAERVDSSWRFCSRFFQYRTYGRIAMKLSEWARRNGVSYITAWRWFKTGILPVPARQLSTGTILVEELMPGGRTVLYARVSSTDQ